MGSTRLEERVAAARERLDAHVRDIVAWHFDPGTGTPFWLERAAARALVRRWETLLLVANGR